MFAAAAEATGPARERLDAEFKRAERLAPCAERLGPANADLAYAHALALLAQHRPVEASRTLETILAARPDDYRARRAKLHVDLKRRAFDPALDDLKLLADTLARSADAEANQADKKVPANEATVKESSDKKAPSAKAPIAKDPVAKDPVAVDARDRLELAELMGRAAAYLKIEQLEGERAERLAKARAAALASVGEACEAAFLQAEDEVALLYGDAVRDAQSLAVEAQALTLRKTQNDKREIDREKEKIEKVETHVKKEAETVQGAAAELAAIEVRLAQLTEQQAILTAQAAILQLSAECGKASLNSILGRVSPQDYNAQAASVNTSIQLGNVDLQTIGRQQTLLLAQMLPLEGRRQALIAAGTVITQNASNELAADAEARGNVQKQERKLTRQSTKTVAAAKRLVDEGKRLVEEAKRFDTYDNFPLAAEQQRVLALVRQ